MADSGSTVSRQRSFALCVRLIPCPCRSVFKVADINKVSKRKASETIQPLFNKYEKPDEWRYVPSYAVSVYQMLTSHNTTGCQSSSGRRGVRKLSKPESCSCWRATAAAGWSHELGTLQALRSCRHREYLLVVSPHIRLFVLRHTATGRRATHMFRNMARGVSTLQPRIQLGKSFAIPSTAYDSARRCDWLSDSFADVLRKATVRPPCSATE